MNNMYPRTIAITRQTAQEGIGAVGYSGTTPSTQSPVASDIAASIQLVKSKGTNAANLPGDVATSEWKIFSRSTVPNLLLERDYITDDLGRRFEVIGAYPNPLGFSALCKLLEL